MAIQVLPKSKRNPTPPLHFRVAMPVEVDNPFASLSFDDLIDRHPYLPDLTAMLGICEDGLPVLLDLTDPKPGSLLVGSTHPEGVRQLLKLTILSTLARSRSSDLDVLIVSRVPEQWQSFCNLAGAQRIEVLPIYDRASSSAMLRYGRILDQRMNGRSRGGIHLLLVDDLDGLNQLDFDVQINFQWLAKEGPAYQMWTLAGLQAEQVEQNDRFLASFQTRVLGQVSDPFFATWLAAAQPPDTAAFHETQQFCVQINRNWMTFWLPGR